MKKLLILMTLIVSFVAIGAAQKPTYHPAPAPAYHPPASHPAYHPPASHPAPAYHPPASHPAPHQSTSRQNAQPRQNTHTTTHNNTQHNDRNAQNNQRNADRNKRNADRNAAKAHTNAVRNENKARHNRNKQRRNDYRAAHSAFRGGRFNDRYYAAHFGATHAVVFSTPGLWVGTPYASPFWWGGFQWGFGPGIFWPSAWGMGDGVFIEYLPGVGYVLANPAFPDTTLPLVADVDAQPVNEPDQL
ncbi:MAG: hypothetical protein ACLPXT_09060 [Terracidiphilus sp.]